MNIRIHYLAVIGYALLAVLSLYKISFTAISHYDLIANMFLVVGLSALATYNYRLINTKHTDRTDKKQKGIRYIAHVSIIVYILLSLLSFSQYHARFYDIFYLFGHSYLLYAVNGGTSQYIGMCSLALYYLFATYPWTKYEGLSGAFQFIGRLILLVFFTLYVIAHFPSK